MLDWESEDTGCRRRLPGMNFAALETHLSDMFHHVYK